MQLIPNSAILCYHILAGKKPSRETDKYGGQGSASELSLYIYGTLTPSHKSGKKWGKVFQALTRFASQFALCIHNM